LASRPPLASLLAGALAVAGYGCAFAPAAVPHAHAPAASIRSDPELVSMAQRFRARLDRRERFVLPPSVAGAPIEVDRPFLCFVVEGEHDYGNADDDLASFRSPCANDDRTVGSLSRLEHEYGITASTIARDKDLLGQAFPFTSSLLQKLLLSERLKAIDILVGAGINGFSDGTAVGAGKGDSRRELVFALGLNAAAFDLDSTRGLETFLGYFESFQSLRGGLEHRARTLVAERRYRRMPGGPSVTLSLRDEVGGRPLRGPVGFIVKVLQHEMGHCMLSFVDPPALAPPDPEGRGDYTWAATPVPPPYRTARLQSDADAPRLIFTKAPASRANSAYTFESAELNRLRDVLCFARDSACGAGRHEAGAPGFVEDLLETYRASGLLTAVSTWRPDDALCEWESELQLERFVRSWKVFPAPETSDRFVDVIAEMQRFPRRADVVRYLEYRRSVLLRALDDRAAAPPP